MSDYSISEFLNKTAQNEAANSFFNLENNKLLEINLSEENPLAYTQLGRMVAYKGDISYRREGTFEGGIGKFLKKKFTGEASAFMKAEGTGQLYVANQNSQIVVLDLDDEAMVVNGRDLLAFEPSLEYDIKMMKSVSGMMAGGLFNVEVHGSGFMAITSHGKPLTLEVTEDQPVYADPNSAIAWSANLESKVKTDINLGTFIGRSSGETVQMEFSGNGFVIVQPSEGFYLMS